MGAQEALEKLRAANLREHGRGVCGYELCSPERFAAFGLVVRIPRVRFEETSDGAVATVGIAAVEAASGDRVEQSLIIEYGGLPGADTEEIIALATRWLASASGEGPAGATLDTKKP
jgi:hypothetical protein